jgi:hypothetical protein
MSPAQIKAVKAFRQNSQSDPKDIAELFPYFTPPLDDAQKARLIEMMTQAKGRH